jgi:hypothetical protein
MFPFTFEPHGVIAEHEHRVHAATHRTALLGVSTTPSRSWLSRLGRAAK